MKTIDLDAWRGHRDPEPLDPAAMLFRAQRAGSCRGCLFEGQWSSVCKQAANESVSRGGEDCDAGFIYVAIEPDPRQMTLLDGLDRLQPDRGPDQTKRPD